MTPFEIDVLLHYYVSPSDHEVVKRDPPIWKSTLASLLEADLLARALVDSPYELRITARGEAYCEALQSVPLPIQKWVMP